MFSPGKYKSTSYDDDYSYNLLYLDTEDGTIMSGSNTNNLILPLVIRTQKKDYKFSIIPKKEDKPIERNDGFHNKCDLCIKWDKDMELELCCSSLLGDSECDDDNCSRIYNQVITLAIYEEDGIYKMSKEAEDNPSKLETKI